MIYFPLSGSKLHGLTALLALLGLFSCGPTINILEIDVKLPAEIPLDIQGKNMAVFTPEYDSLSLSDSTLMRAFGDSFAQSLATQTGQNQGDVPLYAHYCGAQALGTIDQPDYASALAQEVQADMIFLVDSVGIGTFTRQRIAAVSDDYREELIGLPYLAVIRVYDAGKGRFTRYIPLRDSVFWQLMVPANRTTLTIPPTAYDDLQRASGQIARNLAESFTEQWETQDRVLFVFGGAAWSKAYKLAEAFNWSAARDIWLEQLDSPDVEKVSCAAYNLAVVCEMEGRFDLALEWLDYSGKTHMLPESIYYRSFLEERAKEKTKLTKPVF